MYNDSYIHYSIECKIILNKSIMVANLRQSANLMSIISNYKIREVGSELNFYIKAKTISE